MAVALPVPYERQADKRMCSAAALAMVYASFRKPVPQQEIWDQVSRANFEGLLAGWTHLMVRDARKRGHHAIAVRVAQVWPYIHACQFSKLRLILNHRALPTSTNGHFTVLLHANQNEIVIHDPQFGPGRRLSRVELESLLRPLGRRCEITGNIVIALAASRGPDVRCVHCQQVVPESVPCPRCHSPIHLTPAAALGCVTPGCAGRLWEKLYCAECDQTVGDIRWDNGIAKAIEERGRPMGSGRQTLEEAFTDFQERLGRAALHAPNARIREQLGAIQEETSKLFENFIQESRSVMGQAKQEFEQQLAAIQQKEQAILQSQTERKAAKAAAVAAPAADVAKSVDPAELTKPKVDLELGDRLNQELLAHFGKLAPSSSPASSETMDWDDWLGRR